MYILPLDFINQVIKLLNVIMAKEFSKMQVCTRDYLNCNVGEKENDNSFICPFCKPLKKKGEKLLKSRQYA